MLVYLYSTVDVYIYFMLIHGVYLTQYAWIHDYTFCGIYRS